MALLPKNPTIADFSQFVNAVYGVPNDRYYTLWDMLANVQRFAMRAIKGVRKGDREKIKENILITLSWYTSLMNRVHIDIGEVTWDRFPYLCSYCGKCPCVCKAEKVVIRRKAVGKTSMKPGTLSEYQEMFSKIYPRKYRSEKDAAIHLAEEAGELSEAFHVYMSDRSAPHFEKVCYESADFFSCIMGVMNSSDIDCSKEIAILYKDNCPVCHMAPCTCSFLSVSEFRS